jgi:mono/diheme cytochrome c family protein
MSDHHDHPLPPPEPDAVKAGGITFWGLISFISVIVTTFGLSGYFWMVHTEVSGEQNDLYTAKKKTEAVSGLDAAMKALIESKSMIIEEAQAAPAPALAPTAVAAAPATAPAAFTVDAKLAKKGQELFNSKTCSVCHSIDGSRKIGPTMKGIWGRKEKMTDGTELYVDRAYFVNSIKNPMAQIVEGYPPGMAQLPVSDDEIEALLHYVASIK